VESAASREEDAAQRKDKRLQEKEEQARAKAEAEAQREDLARAKAEAAATRKEGLQTEKEERAKATAEAAAKRREDLRNELEERARAQEESAKAKAEAASRRKADRQAEQEARSQAQAAAKKEREEAAAAAAHPDEEVEVDDEPLPPLTLEELCGPGAAPGVAQHVYLVTLSALVVDSATEAASGSSPGEAAPAQEPEGASEPQGIAAAAEPEGPDGQAGARPEGAKDPDALSREEVRDALLDAIGNPVWRATRTPSAVGRRAVRTLSVEKLVVFREEHRDGRIHFHIAVKLAWQTPWEPLKLALRQRSGLCSHWSDSHRKWWSALRYGVFTTPKKPVVDRAPVVHTADGRALDLYEESQEPFAAAGMKRRREGLEREAAGR
jgi:hypothetical protein